MSDALKIVDPYHPEPLDRDKVGPVEVTSCMRCAWSRGVGGPYPKCRSPIVTPREPRLTVYIAGVVGQLLREGNCPGYHPSFPTRLLRLIGLRKPVMR